MVVDFTPRPVHCHTGSRTRLHQFRHRRDRQPAPAQRIQTKESQKGGSFMTTYSRQGAVNASNMLLEINHVSVDYSASSGTVHALTDVSISLERGQILGLAGESGSGKSTLAYAITRLLRPPAEITGGQILYYQDAAHQERARSVSIPPSR